MWRHPLQCGSWPEGGELSTTWQSRDVPLGSTPSSQRPTPEAIGTDALTADAVARSGAPHPVCWWTPPQPFGMAEHHARFCRTISFQPPSCSRASMTCALPAARAWPLSGIFVINGHGGNIATMPGALRRGLSARPRHGGSCRAPGLRCQAANWSFWPERGDAAWPGSLYGDEGHTPHPE